MLNFVISGSDSKETTSHDKMEGKSFTFFTDECIQKAKDLKKKESDFMDLYFEANQVIFHLNVFFQLYHLLSLTG